MRIGIERPELQSLLEAPSSATLTIYRDDGTALTSPVWFRVQGGSVEFVISATDRKVGHLRREPRCLLLIFEAVRPFRGLQVRGLAALTEDVGARARLAIASRYLGPEDGRAYADLGRRPPGFIVSLPLHDARAWSLADTLPD